jgi:hypothetical protein
LYSAYVRRRFVGLYFRTKQPTEIDGPGIHMWLFVVNMYAGHGPTAVAPTHKLFLRWTFSTKNMYHRKIDSKTQSYDRELQRQ